MWIGNLFIKKDAQFPHDERQHKVIITHANGNIWEKFDCDTNNLERLEDSLESMLDEIKRYRRENNIIYGED